MGTYTEIYVNVDLKKETPDDVIQVLKAMCGMLPDELRKEVLEAYPFRWVMLFNNCSYYTPRTSCKKLTYDSISKHYSLLGKGDIKNYEDEIQQFFDWIMPWVDAFPGEFVGYHRYEECSEPTLVFKPGGGDCDEEADDFF